MRFPVIDCAVCGKQVDDVSIWTSNEWDSQTIRVKCHGATEEMTITARDMLDRDLVDQLYNQRGLAFAPPVDKRVMVP